MIIGSRLLPLKARRTYFHTGRAAFAYLIGNVVQPQKVYLPTFTCWSLVTTMMTRFPHITLGFYEVKRDLTCIFPSILVKGEALIIIHYFGHQNTTPIPLGEGTIIEDLSHSYLSQIPVRGHYRFGSYRKILNVADGGYLDGYYNPLYEPDRKLDSWLRLVAEDWRDLREAENMLDRFCRISDISSQSLIALLSANETAIIKQRQANNEFLTKRISVGVPHVIFSEHECPMIHNRILRSIAERDSLRQYLFSKKIYTSIHWPTHDAVLGSGQVAAEAKWIEQHVISFPISHDYNREVMEQVCREVEAWATEHKHDYPT